MSALYSIFIEKRYDDRHYIVKADSEEDAIAKVREELDEPDSYNWDNYIQELDFTTTDVVML